MRLLGYLFGVLGFYLMMTSCGVVDSTPPGLYFDSKVTVAVGDTTPALSFRKVAVTSTQGTKTEVEDYTNVSLSLVDAEDSLYLGVLTSDRKLVGLAESTEIRVLAKDKSNSDHTAEILVQVNP